MGQLLKLISIIPALIAAIKATQLEVKRSTINCYDNNSCLRTRIKR